MNNEKLENKEFKVKLENNEVNCESQVIGRMNSALRFHNTQIKHQIFIMKNRKPSDVRKIKFNYALKKLLTYNFGKNKTPKIEIVKQESKKNKTKLRIKIPNLKKNV